MRVSSIRRTDLPAKQRFSVVALMAALLLSVSGGETSTETKNTATVDCAIEIQVCVLVGTGLQDRRW